MSFSHKLMLVVFPLESERQSPRLSILTDLNAVVWMVSILPLIDNSSNHFFRPSETFPSAPATISITVTLKFRSLFVLSEGSIICLSFCFLFFPWFPRTEKLTKLQVLFILLITTNSGLLFGIKCLDFISKSQTI